MSDRQTEIWYRVFAVLELLGILVGPSILVSIFLALVGPAASAECLHSAGEVRASHPGAWPTWRYGEHHQRCWFQKGDGPTRFTRRHGRATTTVDATPLPRAAPYRVVVEAPAEAAPAPIPDATAAFSDRFGDDGSQELTRRLEAIGFVNAAAAEYLSRK